MRMSLKTKVSIVVALIIIFIFAIRTYFFITEAHRNIEKKLITRGEALSHSLSKAAEEGLIAENLDIIKKAGYIVKAEDVVLVQVYSSIWDAIDAYPFEKLKEPPAPDAERYFKDSNKLFYKKINKMYDFYNPILFRSSENSPAISIGYVRLILSSSAMQKELKGTVITNIIATLISTLLIIIVCNILINRLVINPVTRLQKSVLMFKNGKLPETVPVHSNDEIGELITTFNQMAETIDKDVVEIKKAENKIFEAMHDWENTFNTITDMITIHDKDFNIIRANTAAEKMLGLPFLQVTKAKCYGYYHGTESPPETCPSCQCLKTKTPATFEMFEPHLNKFIEIRAIPRFDSNNNLIGLIHVVRDITERKRIEEELKKKIDDLEKFYDMAVGRELKMKELKNEIKKLTAELSKYKKDETS